MLRDLLRPFTAKLPLDIPPPYQHGKHERVFVSAAMMRSGQHLIIDWICRGLNDAAHINDCTLKREGAVRKIRPKFDDVVNYKGGQPVETLDATPANAFISFENRRLNNSNVEAVFSNYGFHAVYILRDPLNWLASRLVLIDKLGVLSIPTIVHEIETYEVNLAIVKAKRQQPNHTAISYGSFITDLEYRQSIANELGLKNFEAAELALTKTSDFGGGSSFTAKESDTARYFNRWQHYQNSDYFYELLRLFRHWDASEEFFGELPGKAFLQEKQLIS